MKSPWINCKRKLPDYDIPVLVFDGCICSVAIRKARDHYEYMMGYPYRFDIVGITGYEWEWSMDYGQHITHWMPLPKLPRKKRRTNSRYH